MIAILRSVPTAGPVGRAVCGIGPPGCVINNIPRIIGWRISNQSASGAALRQYVGNLSL